MLGSKILDAWRAGHCDDPCDRSRLRAAAKAVPELAASLSDQERHDLGMLRRDSAEEKLPGDTR